MKDKSFIAGILTLIAGAFGILWLGGSFLAIRLVRFIYGSSLYAPVPNEFYSLIDAIYLSYGVFGAILGIIGIIGGVLALKKRHWGLALTGAIVGVITFFPAGIPAIILISMGKEEFVPSRQVLE